MILPFRVPGNYKCGNVDVDEFGKSARLEQSRSAAMSKKLSLLLAIALLAVCFAIIAYRRSHSPSAVIRSQLFYLGLSGIIPMSEPAVDVSEIMARPSFAGVVTNCIVTNVPRSREGDRVDVVVIDVKREDGLAFLMVAAPATKAELDAAKRLMPGHAYEFPEALETPPND
jgi:hypothetical protein